MKKEPKPELEVNDEEMEEEEYEGGFGKKHDPFFFVIDVPVNIPESKPRKIRPRQNVSKHESPCRFDVALSISTMRV